MYTLILLHINKIQAYKQCFLTKNNVELINSRIITDRFYIFFCLFYLTQPCLDEKPNIERI